jgi:natural product biosynthesis luciferase-like monooxygenase protein
MVNSRRCVLIGSESLLIECATVLAQHGHRILAVVSDREPIRRHAQSNGIEALADTAALRARFAPGSFDVLLSITHLAVLPREVLALPLLAAINFHDGPLPEYAGLNTPVWSLIHRERQHGIAWHRMTEQVDRGNVLIERRFDIAADDTALTLNTRCFEAAIDSFTEWLPALASGDLRGQPQVRAEGRPGRVFQRRDRPIAASMIVWTEPAASIEALVRALDFGGYANPVGAAKLVHRGVSLIVSRATVLADSNGSVPGRVVAADTQAIVVACGEGSLRIDAFNTLDGTPITMAQALERLGLTAAANGSARLDLVDSALSQRLSALDRQVAASEGFWAERLERMSAVEWPLTDRAAPPAAPRFERIERQGSGWSADERLAAFAVFLARLADKAAFEIGHAEPPLSRAVAGIETWFAPVLPLSVKLDFDQPFAAACEALAAEQAAMRRHGTYAHDLIARRPELRKRAATLTGALPVAVVITDAPRAAASELTLAIAEDGSRVHWIFDAHRIAAAQVKAMADAFEALCDALRADPAQAIGRQPLITATQRDRMLGAWNATQADVPANACVHHLIEAQAVRTPERAALVCEGATISYRDLDTRANRLARRLAALGAAPDQPVGLCLPRSIDLIVALLAIHKAGAAYVPLDPTYPRHRIAHMLDDAQVPVLVTLSSLAGSLPSQGAQVVCIDTDAAAIARESGDAFNGGAQPANLAYLIYTSGSTGKPKGVMVEHRQVVNFFAGMDREIGGDEPGTWLAVTSLSFDISVLELCWTLARGYTVVIAADEQRAAAKPVAAASQRPLDFSLFYFSSDAGEGGTSKYKLLLEGAKFADRHGFSAVWTPERHFHAFGGLYPNPAVAGAAIAAITEHVQIRAGSVVLPLHHPARVAEEWSVVDNLSNGRVGISFASGWQPDDFVLKPENFADNKAVMLKGIETVRSLWRGESQSFPGPLGKPVELRTLPRPVQPELPFWVTSAGNPETFIAAGRLGARVLTHLLGQTTDELRDKLAAYRKAWTEAGHPGEGFVSLMLHSFVGPDEAKVRETVRRPLIEYLRSSLNLVKQYAWSFPAFKRREGMDTGAASIDLQSLAPEEMDALLEHSFERYYETSGLFGTPQDCADMIERIKAIGVDDVACLIDFGVDSDTVLAHLPYLDELRRASMPQAAPHGVGERASLGALMKRHAVTNLQCTPSMARMLVGDDEAREGLRGLRRMLVGGEALPPSLAAEIKSLVSGPLNNMYGPTETTIWSATQVVERADAVVPLGRPLANQQIYILDSRQQPLPAGVPGELVIGGEGVVRGYLRRPELNAERFLPDPIRGEGRVYRTGDLARQRDDGVIEFLGRLDHQVKVRGFRIELGEIEAALLAQPGIREGVVVAREDTPGDVRLVAYLVASESVQAQTLRDALRTRLPEFMLPSHFVMLAALPQTPNGKIDRKALPAPESAMAAAPATAYVAPTSDIERTIADVWRDVLKLPDVGTRDNFFDLGGHSLLAVQAHRRLREALGRNLSITDIFRFPTIQSLGQYLGGGHEAAAQQGRDRAEGRRAALARRQAVRAGAPT